MSGFNVDAGLFKVAALFQGGDQARYYLCGVHIEAHPDGGVFLVATDGHRMMVIHDQTGAVDGNFIVRLGKDQTKSCSRHRSETESRRLLSNGIGSPAYVASGVGNVAIENDWHIDATFPDWRRVLRGANGLGGNDAFDGKLLASFAKAAEDLTGSSSFSIETSLSSGPALIRFHEFETAVGALMPVRWKSSKGLPGFLDFPVDPVEGADVESVAA